MKSPNVNIYKVQMAYFYKEKSEIRAFGLISSLYNQLKDFFKTEPQTIPIPDDAPADVPRCVWSDINTSLTFNKLRLDFSFNIPSKYDWEQLLHEFNDKITKAFDGCEVTIDRVGLVSELMSIDNLHNKLNEFVNIEKFNGASVLTHLLSDKCKCVSTLVRLIYHGWRILIHIMCGRISLLMN